MKAPNTLDKNIFVQCAEEGTQGNTTLSNTRRSTIDLSRLPHLTRHRSSTTFISVTDIRLAMLLSVYFLLNLFLNLL